MEGFVIRNGMERKVILKAEIAEEKGYCIVSNAEPNLPSVLYNIVVIKS